MSGATWTATTVRRLALRGPDRPAVISDVRNRCQETTTDRAEAGGIIAT